MNMRIVILWLTFLCLAINVFGQIPESPEVEKIFSAWNKKNSPGGAVAIVKEGKLIFAKGYGSADLEHQIPITPATVFYIASTGKQFTAFCILLLEEQGKLSLQDELQKFLPDFPKYQKPITVANLLHHTSGLRDYSTLWDLSGKNYLDHVPKDEVYELLTRQDVNFPAGEQYLYSNSCYLLLGMIVEKVSGKSLKDFAREQIFDPLGMKNTMFLDDNRQIVANRAFSYEKMPGKDEFYNVIRRFDLVGSGGVYSSVEDLYLWDQNFYNNKLGKGGQEIIRKMHDDGFLNDGSPSGYAGGLEIRTYHGLKTVSHSGSHASYRAQLLRFPDQKFSVIVLANRSDASGERESFQVADIFLRDKFTDQNKTATKTSANLPKISESEAGKFTGFYLNEKRGYVRQIIYKDNDLYYYRSSSGQDRAVQTEKNEFRLIDREGPSDIRFSEEKGVRSLTYLVGGKPREVMFKFEPKTLSDNDLRRFEGDYYSPELKCTYQLKMQENQLVHFINGRKIEPLSSVKDKILSDSFGMFIFKTDEKGRINGFELSNTRVTQLKFIKQ